MDDFYSSIKDLLLSHEKSDVVLGINQIVEGSGQLVDIAIGMLENGCDKYFAAEKLPAFGSRIIPRLIDVLEQSDSLEVKRYCALLLGQFYDWTGREILEEEILGLKDLALQAESRLEKIDPVYSRNLMIKALDDYPFTPDDLREKDYTVASMLYRLYHQPEGLPQRFVDKFSGENLPDEIRFIMSHLSGLDDEM